MEDPILERVEKWRRMKSILVRDEIQRWLSHMQMDHPLAFKSYGNYEDEIAQLAREIVTVLEEVDGN
jgi:acetyl-CoA carboxylase beta subunit